MRGWVLVAVGALALAAGLVALVLVFGARDEGGVEGGTGSELPGRATADVCAAAFGDTRLARALQRGNVLLAYGDPSLKAQADGLRDDLAGAPDPVLETAGQAVIVVRRRAVDGLSARSWARTADAADASDPALTRLIEAELGRGDPDGEPVSC